MRVVLFTETFLPKVDGVVRTLCHLLEHLARKGHESLLLAPAPAPDRYADTRVEAVRAYPFPLYRELRLAPPWTRIAGLVEGFEPDLVHLLNPISLGVAGLRWTRRRGLPLVASYHTDLPGYVRRYGFGGLTGATWALLRHLHNQADLNLVPSRAVHRELAGHGFERLAIWAHGVDAERFHPRFRDPELRRQWTLGVPEAPVLLYVGRLAAEKRLDLLLPVVQTFRQIRLVLVGDGPERSRLQRLFAGTPTTFTGFLQGEELARAYATADLFVFPSDTETFGNVVVEAMASGLPVVAAAAGGPLELVEDGRTGRLVPPGDPAALVRAVGELLRDPERAGELGRTGRTRAECLSWEEVLDTVIHGYEWALERKRLTRDADDRLSGRPAAPLLLCPEVELSWAGAMEAPAGQAAAAWFIRVARLAAAEPRP
ncbi:MAG: glycosyltransferase family 1 protein [Candidatus Latescibacterota bacterium]|jgi:glycosyltransferase involved in cell wall biosynthesis